MIWILLVLLPPALLRLFFFFPHRAASSARRQNLAPGGARCLLFVLFCVLPLPTGVLECEARSVPAPSSPSRARTPIQAPDVPPFTVKRWTQNTCAHTEGLDISISAPDIGVNIILWVASLPSAMTAQQFFECSISPGAAHSGEVEDPQSFQVGEGDEAVSFWGCRRVVEVRGPHPSGVQVSLRNKEMNLYHTTSLPGDEDSCVCYNCSFFAGEGLWEQFEPIFCRFLRHVRFRDHKSQSPVLLSTACLSFFCFLSPSFVYSWAC